MISKTTARLIKIMPKPIVMKVAGYLVDWYLHKYAKITVVNKDRLDKLDGPVIFICNHLSNSDGLVLNKILHDKDVWFVAGVKLSKNDLTNLGLEIFKIIPISPNTADKNAISSIIKLLKSGQSILIFPEGTRSRTGSLIKAKKGILLIARMSKVPIVPIGIHGTETLLPINDEDMGRESFNHADVKVTVGENFYLPLKEDIEDKECYEQRSLHFLMKKIAELLPEKYQGEYRE